MLNSVEAATLAAGWAKNYIQAVFVHAPHLLRTSTTKRVRLCNLFSVFATSWDRLA